VFFVGALVATIGISGLATVTLMGGGIATVGWSGAHTRESSLGRPHCPHLLRSQLRPRELACSSALACGELCRVPSCGAKDRATCKGTLRRRTSWNAVPRKSNFREHIFHAVGE
jgi:hypothetical protein